jgi:hypothetical protein
VLRLRKSIETLPRGTHRRILGVFLVAYSEAMAGEMGMEPSGRS